MFNVTDEDLAGNIQCSAGSALDDISGRVTCSRFDSNDLIRVGAHSR